MLRTLFVLSSSERRDKAEKEEGGAHHKSSHCLNPIASSASDSTPLQNLDHPPRLTSLSVLSVDLFCTAVDELNLKVSLRTLLEVH